MGCWLEVALSPWLCGSLSSAAHSMVACFITERKQEWDRWERDQNLLWPDFKSDVHLIAAFYALEASHWVQITFKGGELQEYEKSGDRGHWKVFQRLLTIESICYCSYRNYYGKSDAALVLVRVLQAFWTCYPMHAACVWEQRQKCPIAGYSSWFLSTMNTSFMTTADQIQVPISSLLLSDAPASLPSVTNKHDGRTFPTVVALPPCSLKGLVSL